MLSFVDITETIRGGGDGPECGLYVFVHRNQSGVDLWDSPQGKIIAGGGEWLLKSGKYEKSGLRNRLKSYHKWSHGGASRAESSLFTSYLMSAHLLPMNSVKLPYDCNPAAAFEQLWNSAWLSWVTDEGIDLATQNNRSEYLRLRNPAEGYTVRLGEKGKAFAALVDRMIEVMAVSHDSV
jgi:hypothetical protein